MNECISLEKGGRAGRIANTPSKSMWAIALTPFRAEGSGATGRDVLPCIDLGTTLGNLPGLRRPSARSLVHHYPHPNLLTRFRPIGGMDDGGGDLAGL